MCFLLINHVQWKHLMNSWNIFTGWNCYGMHINMHPVEGLMIPEMWLHIDTVSFQGVKPLSLSRLKLWKGFISWSPTMSTLSLITQTSPCPCTARRSKLESQPALAFFFFQRLLDVTMHSSFLSVDTSTGRWSLWKLPTGTMTSIFLSEASPQSWSSPIAAWISS